MVAQERLCRKNPSTLTALHFLPLLLHYYCPGLCPSICLTRRVHLERIHHGSACIVTLFCYTTEEVNTCSLFQSTGERGDGEEKDPADLVLPLFLSAVVAAGNGSRGLFMGVGRRKNS